MNKPNQEVYNYSFYVRISEWSSKSAQVIIPIIIELAHPRSVVDVGCGDGAWLSVFHKLGVTDLLGIDGDHVTKDILRILPENFISQDLNHPISLDRRFDVAICLEVAEHLNASSAETLVASLTNLSDILIFSAAIPFQPGDRHINLQWPEYWISLFSQRGFSVINSLKYRIWNEPNVAFYYKQNILMFVNSWIINESDSIRCEYEKYKDLPISVVHPELFILLTKKISKLSIEQPFVHILYSRLRRRLKGLIALLRDGDRI